MKKILTTAVFLSLFSTMALAQSNRDIGMSVTNPTRRGNLMVGSNLFLADIKFQSGANSYSFGISPRVGYFLYDNIAIGGNVELGLTGQDNYRRVDYSIMPFARIFVGRDRVSEIPRRAKFFVEGGVGFGGSNTRVEVAGNDVTTTTNGPKFYVMPGADFFINNMTALELGLRYAFTGGDPDVNQLSLNVGFQIFLNRGQARAMSRETEQDLDRMKRSR